MKPTTRGVSVSDIQYPYHDPKVFHAALDFILDYKPTVLVLNGDGFDFYDLSRFDKDPQRRFRLQEEIEGFKAEILAHLIGAAPKAKRYYTEGNHELRLRKYLWHHAPELSSIKGLNVPELLELKKLGFTYLPTRQVLKFGHLRVMHSTLVRQHSGMTARALVERHGVSVLHGHSHRLGEFYKRDQRGVLGGYEQGCLCDLNPEYEDFPNWMHGWATFTVFPNDLFSVELVKVVNRSFYVYGGEVREL